MKSYSRHTIIENVPLTHNTFRLTLTPQEEKNVTDFNPGQFVLLLNPDYDSRDPRPFSISSPPQQKESFEFSIKIYGNWTKSLSQKKEGTLLVSPPMGDFIWNDNIQHAVFLLAGIGISPVMSMLRSQRAKGRDLHITMLYGNLLEEDIVYQEELDRFKKTLTRFNLHHILSDITDTRPWQDYRGFITREIIEKEVQDQGADYFVIGQPIFMEKMLEILKDMDVPHDKIHIESIEELNIPSFSTPIDFRAIGA